MIEIAQLLDNIHSNKRVNMKAIAIIGSGFGDEGKGHLTNYFSSLDNNSVVMRYNGSCQVGHTVHHGSKRHIFSHFGSGTFYNRPTVLSEFFVNHPALYVKERNELISKEISVPDVYVHPNSMVTTPFDMLVNQIVELGRGQKRHGSVGVGFGETFDRNDYMPIHTKELFGNLDDLRTKVELIRDRWVPTRILDRNEGNDHLYAILTQDGIIENFLNDVRLFVKGTKLFEYDQFKNNNIIFEGAQGLMLDQTYGFFPHVTRSNTGLKNIMEILKHYNVDSLSVNHISRCYTTRHGAGPLPFERDFPGTIVDNTNHSHVFQGSLRYSPLNLDEMLKAVEWDYDSIGKHSFDIIQRGTFTCVDQLTDEVPIIIDEELKTLDKQIFLQVLVNHADYISNGTTTYNITKS